MEQRRVCLCLWCLLLEAAHIATTLSHLLAISHLTIVNWEGRWEMSLLWDFPVVQMVKNLPAMQETQVQSLGQEDPLEKGMTTHPLQYSCLENPRDRGPHSPLGSQRVRQDWATLAGETPKKFSPRPEPIPGSSVHHGGILKLLSFPGSYEEKRGGSPLLLCPQTHLFFIILHLDSAWRSKE